MRNYVKPRVASDMLKLDIRWLRKLAADGKIRHIKTPGGHYRYDVDGYIAEQEARCNHVPNHD